MILLSVSSMDQELKPNLSHMNASIKSCPVQDGYCSLPNDLILCFPSIRESKFIPNVEMGLVLRLEVTVGTSILI